MIAQALQEAADSFAKAGEKGARSSSFYAALRILPCAKREAMYAIYDYCRALDDIADEPGELAQKQAQLRAWQEALEVLFASDTPRVPPSLQPLQDAITQFGLRKDDMMALWEGMQSDLTQAVYAPCWVDLRLYCDRVACAVGRLSVRVFGLEEADGIALAHHLGLALQLTNILRDLDEDAELGRLYLPRELLEVYRMPYATPLEALVHPQLSRLCEDVAKEAQAHFDEADSIMRRCKASQVRTPKVMFWAYRGILHDLLKRGFAPPRLRPRFRKGRLLLLLLRDRIMER